MAMAAGPIQVPQTPAGRTARMRAARAGGLNGIEAVVVEPGRRRLRVLLLGKAPDGLAPANVRVDGGVQVRDLRVVSVEVDADPDPEEADRVVVDVDRPGDLSGYRLRLVQADPFGRPGTQPLPGFDPLLHTADVDFAQDCPATTDCQPLPCPPAGYPEPVIDYLAKDYASLRRALLERLSLTLPQWHERHAADLLIALVELLAFAGDELSYQQDAVAAEAYLDTARLRTSVRRHARLVDYPMHDGCAARTVVCLDSGRAQVTLPAGTVRFRAGDQVFEPVTDEDMVVRPAHRQIPVWPWGEPQYCLPAGTTAATLRDGDPAAQDPTARVLDLRPGDLLVFEEVIGADTGLTADADHTHRQAVRLLEVRPGQDPVLQQPVVEVIWGAADALTFPLRVSAVGGPDCSVLQVGVASGNAVLVEHGSSVTWCGAAPGQLTWPTPPAGIPGCPCPPDFGCPDCAQGALLPAYPPVPVRYRPTVPPPAPGMPLIAADLAAPPVTWHEPFPWAQDVSRGQAARLEGVADRARARLAGYLHDAELGVHPDQDAADWVDTLFGAAVRRRLPWADDPLTALRTLSARFDELLARKLDRLSELACRARGGYLLTASNEGWEIGQAWGEAEGQALDPQRPVYRGPAATALAPDPRQALPAVQARVVGDPGDPWSPVRDLLDSGTTDRDLVGELDDDTVLHLRFGDGRAGATPPPGSTVELDYRLGGGPAGNVGAQAIDTVELCGLEGVTLKVRNPLPATGGTDPEPVTQVRRRAPVEATQRLLRAVTAADYAAAASDLPGVQSAGAQLRWTGSWYEAQVALDLLSTDLEPDAVLGEARERLHRFRRIGHDVVVGAARTVPLQLSVCVVAEPDVVADHVRAGVARVLGPGRLPDGRLGLFHPEALTFGTPVRVSQVVAAMAAVPGVRSARVTVLERLFDPGGSAVPDGVLVLDPDEIARLDGDPSRPENGVLNLDVAGGR